MLSQRKIERYTMLHLGDITKINGANAPIVDCIIGGSPCQDLSVAGKRAGLAGARSGLFMDQIRVIKEMRNESRANGARGVAVRPRYMVWENVPGAFSSNGGEDFRVVLEEVARVCDERIAIPRPPKGKWQNAGVIIGDGYSIAWRVLDAQYWGVPQRRRRIALVADFGGESASEILFERKSLSGNSNESREAREDIAIDTQTSTGESALCFEGGVASRLGGYCWNDVAPTLRTEVGDNRPSVVYTVDQGGGKSSCNVTEDVSPTITTTHDGAPAVAYNIGDRFDIPKEHVDVSPTLTARCGTGGNNTPAVCIQGAGKTSKTSNGDGYKEEIAYTLNTVDVHGVCYSKGRNAMNPEDYETWEQSDKAHTLNTFNVSGSRASDVVVQNKPAIFDARGNGNGDISCTITGDHNNRITDFTSCVVQPALGVGIQSSCGIGSFSEEVMPTLINGDNPSWQNGVCQSVEIQGISMSHFDPIKEGVIPPIKANDAKDPHVVTTGYIIRRLTPLECERLQGYPDGWTDIGEWVDSKGKIRQTTDSARYKAMGNSIALPPWRWVLKRICAHYERDATMASLFDGVGGFPLIWEQLNGPGSCLWASEIEEFPIAVTKKRFG